MGCQSAGNPIGDLGLRVDQVTDAGFYLTRPEVVASGIDKLGRYPQSSAGLANTALYNGIGAKFTGDLRYFVFCSAKGKRRCACDNTQTRLSGQLMQQFFRDAIPEVIEASVFAEIAEGKHGDGGVVEPPRGLPAAWRHGPDHVDEHRQSNDNRKRPSHVHPYP
ncbi:MAG: hypothetical protein PVI37_12760 [Gammaproteobacteria bacterium]